MNKKITLLVVSVLMLANLFLFTTPVPNNQSRLLLVQLEAMADDEFPPLRMFPTGWSLSAIIDYLF